MSIVNSLTYKIYKYLINQASMKMKIPSFYGCSYRLNKCDVLRDLETFAQLKKHEKHQCRSATFSKAAG